MTMKLCVLLGIAACGNGVHADPRGLMPDAHQTGSGSGSGSAMPGTCSDPDGPLHPYTQASEVSALVVGRWRQCSGATPFAEAQAGVELLANGEFYFLQETGGTLVRKSGFDSQGTWTAYQEGGSSVQFDFHITNTGTGGYPEFEDNPRKMAMRLDYNSEASIWVLVP